MGQERGCSLCAQRMPLQAGPQFPLPSIRVAGAEGPGILVPRS